MGHADGERALIVLLVDLEHLLRRRRRGIRKERNKQRDVVHGVYVVTDRRDPVGEPGLQAQRNVVGGGAERASSQRTLLEPVRFQGPARPAYLRGIVSRSVSPHFSCAIGKKQAYAVAAAAADLSISPQQARTPLFHPSGAGARHTRASDAESSYLDVPISVGRRHPVGVGTRGVLQGPQRDGAVPVRLDAHALGEGLARQGEALSHRGAGVRATRKSGGEKVAG